MASKFLSSIESLAPPLVGVSLLATLFPLEKPAMSSLHPWKVELLVSLLLLAFTCLAFMFRPSFDLRPMTRSRWVYGLLISLGAFLLWSMASAGWAYSAYSVLHHSFVWISFILCFIFAILYLNGSRSASVVNTTFIWVTIILAALCLID